jgi:hypothetical protein
MTIKFAAKGFYLLKLNYSAGVSQMLIMKNFIGVKQALTLVPVAGLKYFPPPVKYAGVYVLS